MATISVMVWRALASGNPLMMAGGVLFLASDGILAVSRFGHPFRWADHCMWASYFESQGLKPTPAPNRPAVQ